MPRNPEEPKATPEAVLDVWVAEDGRCEACKRAMDKRFARVMRVDTQADFSPDNLQLVCVDCKRRSPDPLRTRSLVLGGDVATRVLGQLPPEQVEAGTRWFASQLKRYGVILSFAKTRRTYWLPGVGTFLLEVPEDGPLVVTKAEKLAPTPNVRVKPQERTRGLPPPDCSPMHQAPKPSKREKQPA